MTPPAAASPGGAPLPPGWKDFATRLAGIRGFQAHRFGYVRTTGSTNTDLKRDWDLPFPPPRVLVAGHQTQGRGQFSRSWADRPGESLLCSFTWELSVSEFAALPLGLPLLVGIAVHRALAPGRSRAVPEPWLKWPNDLLAGDRKLGGILVETRSCGASLAAVIGIGVNLTGTPDTVEGGADPGAVPLPPISLRDIGLEVAPAPLLASILGEWSLLTEDPVAPELGGEFIRRSGPFWTRPWKVLLPSGGELVGMAVGLSSGGFLRFQPGVGPVTEIRSALRLLPA